MADSLLTEQQISDLLYGHCKRVIDNMNHDDLVNYAINMMKESFMTYKEEISLASLIPDIVTAEGDDIDSASEFIVGTGIDGETADKLIELYYQK